MEQSEMGRLGAPGAHAGFDARIVVASKKALWAAAQAGRFREDLYFRLSVFTVNLPPLRDRKEDISLLVNAFAGEDLWDRLPPQVREQFTAHSWPGNVRELRNPLERAKHMVEIPKLDRHALVQGPGRTSPAAGPMGPVSYQSSFKEGKKGRHRNLERGYTTPLLQ